MYSQFAVSLVALRVLLGATSVNAQGNAFFPPGPSDQCAIIAAVIDSAAAPIVGWDVVLVDSTIIHGYGTAAVHVLPMLRNAAIDSSTWKDFIGAANVRRPVCGPIIARSVVRTAAESNLNRIFTGRLGERWVQFRREYPTAGGIVRIGHAGISSDGTQALVTMSYSCGELCGAGMLVVLRRNPDGGWRLTHTFTTAVA